MIYLASPYTHSDPDVIQERFERVQALTAKLLINDLVIYSPIVHCHDLANKFGLRKDYAFWANYNHGMLIRARLLYVYTLPGWESSKGVIGEIFFAQRQRIPFYKIDDSSGEIEIKPCA